MTLVLNIEEINYGDVAVRAIPVVNSLVRQDAHAIDLLLDAVCQLPEPLIRSVFEAIPTPRKNQILSAFVWENQKKILETLNHLSETHQLGIQLSGLQLDPSLSLTAQIGAIDEVVLVNRFLPAVKERLLSMGVISGLLRPMVEQASAEQLCGLLDRLTGDRKYELLASVLRSKQDAWISLIENTAKEQQIRLHIASIELRV